MLICFNACGKRKFYVLKISQFGKKKLRGFVMRFKLFKQPQVRLTSVIKEMYYYFSECLNKISSN